jgi:hypothetical protein
MRSKRPSAAPSGAVADAGTRWLLTIPITVTAAVLCVTAH